jgi:hypothetical protein
MESRAPHDAARSVAVSTQPSRTNAYEPPRLESLGTVQELTQGITAPGLPDNTIQFGTSTPSDRRMKQHITAVEPGSVLDGVASLTSRSA